MTKPNEEAKNPESTIIEKPQGTEEDGKANYLSAKMISVSTSSASSTPAVKRTATKATVVNDSMVSVVKTVKLPSVPPATKTPPSAKEQPTSNSALVGVGTKRKEVPTASTVASAKADQPVTKILKLNTPQLTKKVSKEAVIVAHASNKTTIPSSASSSNPVSVAKSTSTPITSGTSKPTVSVTEVSQNVSGTAAATRPAVKPTNTTITPPIPKTTAPTIVGGPNLNDNEPPLPTQEDPPVSTMADYPVVSQLVHDIFVLLETYGPLTGPQLEFNLPDGSTTFLFDVLELLVATGVIHITQPPPSANQQTQKPRSHHYSVGGKQRRSVITPASILQDLKQTQHEWKQSQLRQDRLVAALKQLQEPTPSQTPSPDQQQIPPAPGPATPSSDPNPTSKSTPAQATPAATPPSDPNSISKSTTANNTSKTNTKKQPNPASSSFARDTLKSLLVEFPEIAYDPVYVTALRNVHIDIGLVLGGAAGSEVHSGTSNNSGKHKAGASANKTSTTTPTSKKKKKRKRSPVKKPVTNENTSSAAAPAASKVSSSTSIAISPALSTASVSLKVVSKATIPATGTITTKQSQPILTNKAAAPTPGVTKAKTLVCPITPSTLVSTKIAAASISSAVMAAQTTAAVPNTQERSKPAKPSPPPTPTIISTVTNK